MRLGVLVNPAAAGHRGSDDLATRYRRIVGDPGRVVAPPALDALDAAVAELRAHGVDAVAISGGDGTVHRAVSAIGRVYGDLPPIVLLPSGTMNTIARGCGVAGRPDRLLEAAVAGHLVERVRTTIDVGRGRLGFLVGTGFWARFLREYDRRSGPGSLRAAAVLGRGLASTLVGGPFVRAWFAPFDAELVWDGVVASERRFTMVAVGTVDQVGLGFAPFRGIGDHPGQIGALAFVSPPAGVARQLPGLYAGHAPTSPDRGGRVTTLTLRSDAPLDWSVDGDAMPPEATLHLRAGPLARILAPVRP